MPDEYGNSIRHKMTWHHKQLFAYMGDRASGEVNPLSHPPAQAGAPTKPVANPLEHPPARAGTSTKPVANPLEHPPARA